MIKGVRSTPNLASLSPNKASANDALLLVNPALAAMDENPNTSPVSGAHVTVLLDEAVQALHFFQHAFHGAHSGFLGGDQSAQGLLAL